MIDKFLSFIESNNIAIKKANILVAISGGLDSVVLAHLFVQSEVQFGLAHCNFKLRGKESDADEKFVKELAASLGVAVYTTSFNTEKEAKKEGISIQMAARNLRYSWFEEIRKKHLYDYVATAHHKGDVAETILFNLAKGTGIEGLHGINVKLDKLIRPMLFTDRNKIKAFAENYAIAWREDSSNELIKYSRNKIRHQVIPVLEEINPKAQEALFATSQRIKETELFTKFALMQLVDTLVSKQEEDTTVDIDNLISTSGYLYVLHEILKPFGFNYIQAKSISKSLQGLSGKLFYSSTHVANINRRTLIISPIKAQKKSIWLQEQEGEFNLGKIQVSIKFISANNYAINNNNKIMALDKDKLCFPLEIRSWQKGDVFYPLGMNGKKKLSDFMIDAKIPVNLKEQIRVILSDNKIVGILNHRLDKRFKIEKDTQTIFEITCK